MLGWVMQRAAVAVALRCADEVNNFDILFHEIYLPLPSILVFVPTNSFSRFHEFSRSFLWNQSGSPDKPGGEIPQTKRKVIHLHHEHTRTFSIGENIAPMVPL